MYRAPASRVIPLIRDHKDIWYAGVSFMSLSLPMVYDAETMQSTAASMMKLAVMLALLVGSKTLSG